jgi:predicted DCC family thiol-disulfide oxidoreductase YuxK
MKSYDEIIELSHTHPIIFFDGVCNLCNAWVNFIIKRDDDQLFRFASLQSETGKSVNEKILQNGGSLDTVILFKKGKYYTKSEVAFALIDYLSPVYKVFRIFQVFPLSLRNWVYDIVGSLRYKLFGKKDQCEIPDKNILDFFIDY